MYLAEQYERYLERRAAAPDDAQPRLLALDEFQAYAAELRSLVGTAPNWPPLSQRKRLLRLLLLI
jgi:hypothetical protein